MRKVLHFILFLAALAQAAFGAERLPNIVFIMADDLGYGHLGCYGQSKIQTPNIDRLAAEGVKFAQCYSGSHVCAPSRSVLMTGLHSGHTPVRANGGGRALSPEDVTVAEVLKKAGYATGGFGKWGLGTEGSEGQPNRQGFDEFFGFYHQVHAHFHFPYFLWHNDARVLLPENEGKKRARYAPDEIHAQALRFIRQNQARPFFAYLAYTLPHVELVVLEDSLRPYRGQFPESPLPDPRPGYIGAEEPRATYAGMVSRLDRYVGEVLSLLKELGLERETIVFFTSDNGPQGDHWKDLSDFFDGNGPWRGYKGQFYEGGIRVPMMARWPGRIPAGRTTDHVAAFWDLMPTLAEIAGQKAPETSDGISFLPTLLGAGQQAEHRFLYWEYAYGMELTQAVRMGDWKALKPRGSATLELYNLKDDPAETRNLASKQPAILEQIKAFLATARTEERSFPPETTRVGVADYVR